MKDILKYEPVYVFRPLIADYDKGPFLRYADDKWIKDDGEFDIAFVSVSRPFAYFVSLRNRENILWSYCKKGQWMAHVSQHPGGNAWHYMLRKNETKWGDCWNKEKHPNYIVDRKAMDFCCQNFGCANGRGPEFNVNDPYIKQGLLRIKGTNKIVKPPKIFKCMYCGSIKWIEQND